MSQGLMFWTSSSLRLLSQSSRFSMRASYEQRNDLHMETAEPLPPTVIVFSRSLPHRRLLAFSSQDSMWSNFLCNRTRVHLRGVQCRGGTEVPNMCAKGPLQMQQISASGDGLRTGVIKRETTKQHEAGNEHRNAATRASTKNRELHAKGRTAPSRMGKRGS